MHISLDKNSNTEFYTGHILISLNSILQIYTRVKIEYYETIICLQIPPPRLVYKLFAGGKVRPGSNVEFHMCRT